jgi:UDP-N-acetylmuramate dehydrogenase
MVEVDEVAALSAVLEEADGAGRPVLVLGGGSNLVVSDEGFPGTVVRVAIKGVAVEPDGAGALVRAGAGEDCPASSA